MSKKRPRAGVEVSGEKTPNTEKSPDSFYSQKPVWAFIRAVQDEQSEWTISCSKFIRDVIPKLKSWESMTWRDIFKQTHDDSKSSNHFINKSDLTDEGLKNLPNYYDDECLFSLRINNKERLIGYLEGNVFYILWFDQEHKAVKSHKKHT